MEYPQVSRGKVLRIKNMGFKDGVSIERRITGRSFSRRLAASWGGDECDESQSSSPYSLTDSSSKSIPAMATQVASDTKGEDSQESISSTDTLTRRPSKTTTGHRALQLDQRERRGLKRRGNEQSGITLRTKQLRFVQPNEGTPLLPPAPLDPYLDSLIDSMLAGEEASISEEFWLSDDLPTFIRGDAFIGAKPSGKGGGTEFLDEAVSARDAEPLVHSAPPRLPGDLIKPTEERSAAQSPADNSGKQMQQIQHSRAEALHIGPLSGTSEPGNGLFQALTAEGHVREGIAASFEESVASILPHLYTATSASRPLSWALALPDSAGQSASGIGLPTGFKVISYVDWLDNLFPGIPDSILRTHPFYRYPENNPALGTEVLGDKSMKESWWPWMVSHIESASYEPRRDFVTIGKRSRNVDVASTLHVALDFYRRGLRAPLRMVIGLKEALLCEPGASSKFKAERWNPWREDAARWRRSIEPSLSWHK
ncbi:hypothetical protein, conserved [Eimeria maxima]|uniref:Uncharacterized protein n=1 Tax=Eimeria maxima TaxID=5804 RepID=U6M6L4_EIMMA|nr:hypothetical protein, conserved [Eimeria maxima]CDJ58079.1 hypothetical protein, conserved [Eimeria maxima]